jgi:hypothetical protein
MNRFNFLTSHVNPDLIFTHVFKAEVDEDPVFVFNLTHQHPSLSSDNPDDEEFSIQPSEDINSFSRIP